MSDSSIAIAQSLAASQAAATRQTIQTAMVKQQADADQAMADLLQQGAAQAKAALPAGQGQTVDITA
ncbi:hypothetical protein [Bosea vaviloviae]|uniref:Motility protein n=1 Tax=Bosea vaviloviae TaxID=1526658 RepID=A0A1D7TZC0_9HYPH|nr:hypothetical protein [Bosea vaviloviae]AOO80466.1 hypothetical protein BHK69_08330 [Bosea vaviloviae]